MKSALFRFMCVVFLFGLSVQQCLCADFPAEVEITLGISNPVAGQVQPPYFYTEFDSAGYSDWFWYGKSEVHEYNYHEMLCGEWAAAIYYDGIYTSYISPSDPQRGRMAMWLTDEFIYPDWTTNSDFHVPDPSACTSWHDPNNSTPQMNTGKTLIANGEVEITVDYELVDLNSIIPGVRSPMSYRYPETSNPSYKNSDRYIVLQTYTIKNTKSTDLEGIEFYQLLHAHPADEKGNALNSVYETQSFADPLELYVPINPVHQVGDFRYDITQWNDIDSADATVDHTDWFSASTTVPPDIIGHGIFPGHTVGKPSEGIHIDVELRMLDGQTYLFDTEAAAATGWSIGTLEPNEVKTMTFALMFGCDTKVESPLTLENTAEIVSGSSCVNPDDPELSQIIYTLSYSNSSGDPNDPNLVPAIQYAELVDELPDGVDFVSTSDPNVVVYDSQSHSCIWEIGSIAPGQTGQVTITVDANMSAMPGVELLNRAILSSELGTVTKTERTNVCCWQGDSIYYVDQSATGSGTGLSWDDAFVELQDAFDSLVGGGCASEIWVAEGHYNPTTGVGPAPRPFSMIDGVDVYGGFPAGGGQWEDRDFVSNVTMLCGYYSGVGTSPIVDANGLVEGAVLDGFAIAFGTDSAVTCSNSQLQISNCYITNNAGDGVRCNGASPVITNCVISGNDGSGVMCWDTHSKSSAPEINRNKIYYNRDSGVSVINALSKPAIINNWILENGNTSYGGSGITIFDANEPIMVRNNTIYGNLYIGIELISGVEPDIENCIIWGHPVPLIGCTPLYSCYENAPAINGNIASDPNLVYDDPNDFHLSSSSPCINAGDMWAVEIGELDLDGDVRIYGGQVDIGADELVCDAVVSKADFDGNMIVDLSDYAVFAEHWLVSYPPNDPNAVYDIAPGSGDNYVSLYDLALVVADWMWTPCWLHNQPNNWVHKDDYDQILNLLLSYCQAAGE